MHAHFETTKGDFTIELFEDLAPNTVANFVRLATGEKDWTHPASRQVQTGTPYYDGQVFHRVIDGFMIQGGDPLGNGTGGPGFEFEDEFSPEARHSGEGILSMANRGPNTNGGQFFITLAPTPHLDDRHSVFGRVVQGMEVIRAIGKARTNRQDRPVEDVSIRKVTIQRPE